MMTFPGKEIVASGMGGRRAKFLPPESKWKRKKFRKKNDARRHPALVLHAMYDSPRLRGLQHQNRTKTNKYFLKKVRAPMAPRNTTSFIMRAKKLGGLASLASPATPAILPTTPLSPAARYGEVVVDALNKEWGVDGYGSMNGLIRLRCTDHCDREIDTGTYEIDTDVDQFSYVQSLQQLEQRLDYDLSRFELFYPPETPLKPYVKPLEVRVEEQENRVSQLEDDNFSLKEHVFLLQLELRDLQRRMRLQSGGDYNCEDNPEVCSEWTCGDAASVLR